MKTRLGKRIKKREQKIIERIGNAEAILTNKTPITEAVIDARTGLKYIGVLATGYNVVDTEAAAKRGIPVTNIPVYSTTAVAQFAFALLLEICHHVGHHNQAVQEGRWTNSLDFCFWDYPLIELEGKTMGIIGFGRIGKATGRIAKAMGMEVLAADEMPNDEGKSIGSYVNLDELLAKSDVISLHCPLTPKTKAIINKETISKMKDGVIILNNARGACIDEADLADALNSGKVYAAGVDVVSAEPIKADNPLLKAKNCFLTPHISWAPKECRKRLMDIAVSNLRSFAEGKPMNVVNNV